MLVPYTSCRIILLIRPNIAFKGSESSGKKRRQRLSTVKNGVWIQCFHKNADWIKVKAKVNMTVLSELYNLVWFKYDIIMTQYANWSRWRILTWREEFVKRMGFFCMKCNSKDWWMMKVVVGEMINWRARVWNWVKVEETAFQETD